MQKKMTTQIVAHDIVVFGRGSEPGPNNGRILSEMGKLRVNAIDDYLKKNKKHFTRIVRVLFSAGWAANIGLAAPQEKYREAILMKAYAETIGLKRQLGVIFDTQIESNSTMSDALYAAQSRFFGSWPFPYTEENPLGIVAQSGPEFAGTGLGGHIVRCLDAAEKAFQVERNALFPIVASGVDPEEAGLSEEHAIKLTRAVFKGARTDRSLMFRDKMLMKTIGTIQKSKNILRNS
jgi:hypothetical protein